MEIPDSINALTTEVPSDKFLHRESQQVVDIDDVIFAIKQKLDSNSTKHFLTGITTPKSVHDYRGLLKGILNVYAGCLQQALKNTNIPDEQKDAAVASIGTAFKGIADSFDSFSALIDALNKNKKVIDVSEISFILVGYAIDTIRKIHHTTAQQ